LCIPLLLIHDLVRPSCPSDILPKWRGKKSYSNKSQRIYGQPKSLPGQ
jgi:hypothetical protein